jgi:hypothetical protein
LQRARAEDDARHAPSERLHNVLLLSQSAAELARHIYGMQDGAHTFAINRPSLPGAVEVDDMQVLRALFDPMASHRGGVGAEDGFLRIITLPQTDALAAA